MLQVLDARKTMSIERDDVINDKSKGKVKIDKAAEVANNLACAIVNDGRVIDGSRLRLTDAIMSPDITRFFPVAVEMIMREEMEPATPITNNVFDQMMAYKEGYDIKIGAIGAITIREVAEASEYPEVFFDVDGGDMVSVIFKKYGVKLGMSREAKERDNWGILKLWLQKCSNAFARNKEKTHARILNNLGVTLIDNRTPADSFIGTVTGRGIDGAQNGTFSHNDLMKVYVWGQQRELNYDTIIMHPFAWEMWMVDPELKEIAMNGSNVATYKMPSGMGAKGWPAPHGKLGEQTGPYGNETNLLAKMGAYPYTYDLNPFGMTYNIRPQTLPGLKTVIVSPHVPIARDGVTGKYITNVIFVDSTNCGVHITKEATTSEQWEDTEKEVSWLKLRERNGTALYSQGRGVAVVKNVVCDRNYTFQNMNSVVLSPLTTNIQLIS